MDNTYKKPKVLKSSRAVVRIHSPELSAEEREIRMKQIHKAAEALLKGAIKQ